MTSLCKVDSELIKVLHLANFEKLDQLDKTSAKKYFKSPKTYRSNEDVEGNLMS